MKVSYKNSSLKTTLASLSHYGRVGGDSVNSHHMLCGLCVTHRVPSWQWMSPNYSWCPRPESIQNTDICLYVGRYIFRGFKLFFPLSLVSSIVLPLNFLTLTHPPNLPNSVLSTPWKRPTLVRNHVYHFLHPQTEVPFIPAAHA